MSVLIKGMEMPKEGEYHMTIYVCGDGSAYVDVAELPADEDRFAAVPVPPHGRLIDADELEDGWIWGTTDRLGRCECVERWQIHSAPTIIPAEEEE